MSGLMDAINGAQKQPADTVVTPPPPPVQLAANLPPAPQLGTTILSGRTGAMEKVDRAAEALKNVSKGGPNKLPPAPQLGTGKY